MNRSALVLILGFLVNAGSCNAVAQSLTEEQWQGDLEFLATSIRAQHPDPFHAVSEKAFQNRVDKLRKAISSLEDHEIVVEMASIVAMLQDGHTKIEGGFKFLSGLYPLRLYVFEDGIFVQSAPRGLRGAVGTRLVRLGDTHAEEAYERIAAATSHDNEMTLRNRVPDAMMIPEILHAQRITPNRDRARFVLADRTGREFVLDLVPVPFDDTLDWIETPIVNSVPLYLRRKSHNYWHEYLEDSQTLYVQYNRVRDAPDQTIREYFARLSRLVRELSLRRIVLDVRFNGGGNDYLNAPVDDWVKSSLPLVKGEFYVVIGRGTYSAAQKLVTRLERTTSVMLVGEPTGGRPNHFGDSIRSKLPHSDLTLAISSVYHKDAPGDDRQSIEPHRSAPSSSSDYFSGRDPAFDAILSHSEEANP